MAGIEGNVFTCAWYHAGIRDFHLAIMREHADRDIVSIVRITDDRDRAGIEAENARFGASRTYVFRSKGAILRNLTKLLPIFPIYVFAIMAWERRRSQFITHDGFCFWSVPGVFLRRAQLFAHDPKPHESAERAAAAAFRRRYFHHVYFRKRWGAIVVGFVGVLVAIRPFDADFHWAALVSLAGASCFAIYQILTRMLAGKVSSDTMQLYSGTVGTMVLAPFAFAVWQSPETPLDWGLLFGVGFLGWFGHDMLTRAYGLASASVLTPFAYVMIVYLGVWSWLIFAQAPTGATILGAAIVMAAGLVIWMRERTAARQRRLMGGPTLPPPR